VLDHSCQTQRSPYLERGHDLYGTPPDGTRALLRSYPQLPRYLWEAATGKNAITDVLRASGRKVLATDLVDYGLEPPDCYGRDFLQETTWPRSCGGLVTNPPY
jgi:hypothetical protein